MFITTYWTKMITLKLTVVLLFMSGVRAQQFEVDNVMSFVSYASPIVSLTSFGTIPCALQCTQTPGCVSALYDGDLQTCTLDVAKANTSGAFCDVNSHQCLAYIVKASYVTDGCSTHGECIETNTECRYDKCYCIIGYSYNKSVSGCTFGCDVWGNTYQPHMGKKLSFNGSPFDFDNLDNLTVCFDWCTGKTSFTCIVLEYYANDQLCMIYSPTTDQSASNRKDDSYADVYTRDCGP